jgi:hypothetical protein
MLLYIPNPIFDVFKGLFIRNIINQHDSHCSTVVGCGYCSETFLPGSVPEGKTKYINYISWNVLETLII